MAVLPNETDPVLFVDPDTVLSRAVPLQPLQVIARGHFQLSYIPNAVDLVEFPARNYPKHLRAASSRDARSDAVKDVLRAGVSE
jgi:hypothetical protein